MALTVAAWPTCLGKGLRRASKAGCGLSPKVPAARVDLIFRCPGRDLSTSLGVKPSNGDDTEEMLIMNHEAVLRAEVDYRQRRFLDEAEADRVAKQVRNAK